MMKFLASVWAYIKRKWWYLLLLIGSTSFVCFYGQAILESDFEKFTPITLVFILWLALLLLPLFSEMEFLGIKLKKEVEEVKTEIKEGLSDIKMQMLELKISNSFANTIQIGAMQPLASEKEINDLKQEVLEIRKTSKQPNTNDVNFEVSEQSLYLFQVRLSLEKVITELCDKTDYAGHKSFYNMTKHLNMCQLVNGNISDSINQIIKIANRGVHGEIVSEDYIDFIKTVFPDVQYHLTNLLNNLNYNVCPRCKSAGYSRYANVCPKCGFTHDDD